MKVLFRLTIFIYFITLSVASYSQISVDTIRSQNPEHADTIVIYEEPLIISSKVEIYRPAAPKKKNRLLLSLETGISFHYDYNTICPECIEYYNKVEAATDKLPGYTYSLQLSYSKGPWITGLSIANNNQLSRFNYTDSTGTYTSINKIKTIDGKVSIGYWIGKNNTNKKLSCIPSIVFTISKPYKISGQIYTQDSITTTDQIQNVLDFHSLFYLAGVETKVLYEVKRNFYLTLTPSYNYDLKSILNKEGPFSIQRNMVALKAGIMIGLN